MPEPSRGMLSLSLSDPKTLRDFEDWIKRAHDAGFSGSNRVTISLGTVTVSRRQL